MSDENNKEYKNLADLFAGVFQEIHYIDAKYMVIRKDKFQNFIDFIMYLDVKFDIIERQIKNHRHGVDGGDAWPVPTEESLKCKDSTFVEMPDLDDEDEDHNSMDENGQVDQFNHELNAQQDYDEDSQGRSGK